MKCSVGIGTPQNALQIDTESTYAQFVSELHKSNKTDKRKLRGIDDRSTDSYSSSLLLNACVTNLSTR